MKNNYNSESLLRDLTDLGENYNKLPRNEQEQNILDLINNLLDADNLKLILLNARTLVQCARIERSVCPLCGTELKFTTLPSDKLEAWGKPVEMEPERVAYCPECDWQS